MKQRLIRPLASLLCAVAVLFVFSSFTAPQPRGGGDDEVIQLDFEISWGNASLNTGIPWIPGDHVMMGGAPYWVNLDQHSGSDGVLCLNVQANPYNMARETSFHIEVHTSSGRYECDVHILQGGRSN